ncbi:MAG: hypothetical protein IPM35_23925 [Myxococcales bacterium]|nr:hypothetical protein [Myxococcales bacterium]
MSARGRSLVYAVAAVFCAGLIAFAAHAVKNRRGHPGSSASPIAVAADGGVRIGEPIALEDLTLFPIFSATQTDPGPMTTLGAALGAGAAEVREVGSEEAAPSSTRHTRHGRERSGPVVNTLVIANHGDKAIYVLAGTVVKGGNQDRQIAQDFVVAARSTVPVDAFCVEQGRWTGEREGVGTQGKFEAVEQLANAKVRAAGQYESSQGEVWAEVAKVNSAHGKQKASGTLMATLDDAEVKAAREGLSKRIAQALGKARPSDELVGMAYAVTARCAACVGSPATSCSSCSRARWRTPPPATRSRPAAAPPRSPRRPWRRPTSAASCARSIGPKPRRRAPAPAT